MSVWSRPVFLVLLSMLLVGCLHGQPSGNAPATRPEGIDGIARPSARSDEAILGATLRRSRPIAGEATAAVRDDMSVYARLNFAVDIQSSGFNRIAQLNDGSALDRLWRALIREVAPSARHFALTVTPMQGETSLGEIVLLTIERTDRNTRDDGTGARLESQFFELSASPWVRLGASSGLSYKVIARATTETGVSVSRELTSAIAILGAIGAGPTSGISAVIGFGTTPVVAQMADRMSSILNGAFSMAPRSTATLTLGPAARAEPGRFWRQDRIQVLDERGAPVAVLSVELFMTATLARQSLGVEVPSQEAAFARTQSLRLVASLPVPRENTTRLEMLSEQLSRHPPLDEFARATARSAQDAASYYQRCRRAHDYLTAQLGLTGADALRVRYEIADEGGYNANATLRSSGCFSDGPGGELDDLERMGFRPRRDTSLPRPEDILTSQEIEANLIPILSGTGGSTDRFNRQLAEKVDISAPAGVLGADELDLRDELAVDRGDVVNQFLRGRTSFVACYGVPSGSTPNPQRLDRRLLIIPKDASLGPMVMRFIVNANAGAVSAVEVRRASEGTIRAACDKPELRESRDRLLAAMRQASGARINLTRR